ncbi:MAG: hypothetical protein ACKN9V_01820 [Pseudomonadota bacterium]
MKHTIILLSLVTASLGFSDPSCKSLLGKLSTLAIEKAPVNLKRAQELAEDFVNRKVASEVLTDPGVEAALEEGTGVSEAIEDALLARGMSPGQAKKAAQGWSKSMKSEGIIKGN